MRDNTRTDDDASTDGSRSRISRIRSRFGRWRRVRPFWGGTLLVLASFVIGYVPLQYSRLVVVTGGSFGTVGLLFAALVFFCGVCALTFPRLSSVLGVLGILLSTLSLFGALGGFLVGMLLGGVGGVMCYAWEPPEDLWRSYHDAGESQFVWQREEWDSVQFSWEDDENRTLATVAPLVVALVVTVGYFGAPFAGSAVAATAGVVAGSTAGAGASSSSSLASTTFPARSPYPGGFVLFSDDLEGENYDHTGDGYRETFETSNNDSVAVGEFRFDDVEVVDRGDTPPAANGYGFLLYKNYPSRGWSTKITGSQLNVNDNDGSGVGGADGEDLTIFASEQYIGELEAYISVGPIDVDVDEIATWTCRVNDPDDDFGSISDEREVDLLLTEVEVEVDPRVDTEGRDRGGIAANVHRLEGQEVVVRDFRQIWRTDQQSISFSRHTPPEEC